MGLKSIRKPTGSFNQNRTPVMGIVFKVDKYEGEGTVANPLVMKGAAMFGNDIVEQNQEITVTMNAERFKTQNYSNLMGNAGKKAGTILMLDGCSAVEGQENSFTAAYANIVVSQKERLDPDSPHNSRTVLNFIAEVPSIRFKNPDRQDGEPEYIYWPLNQDTRRFTGADDAPVFDRAWLAGKIAKAGSDLKSVSFDAYYPESSEVASTMEELESVITRFNEAGHSAFIRAFDTSVSEDGEAPEVLTRKSMRNRDGNVEETLDWLRENGVLNGVDNEDLFSQIAMGNAVLEVMPMDRMYYVKDSAQSLLNGFSGSRATQMIGAFGFGGEGGRTHRFAEVYLPAQTCKNESTGEEWYMPISTMVRAGKFQGGIEDMVSPHYTPHAKATAENSADADKAKEDEPDFKSPAMGS